LVKKEGLFYFNYDIHARQDSTLIIAAEKAHICLVKYLVEKGTNVWACGDAVIKNVAMSCDNVHIDIIKFLVEKVTILILIMIALSC